MTAKRPPRAVLLGLAAAAILAGLAAIYVTTGGNGNAGACAAAPALARSLDPLAAGDVAMFQPARRPASLAALRFADESGKETGISDFAGRTVLVNLWATWCVPCRAEMPALDRLQAARGGADFAVVAVNIDTRPEARPKVFLKEVGVASLAYYADPTTNAFAELKKLGLAVGLPATVLVDGKGCSLGAVNGPAAWDSPDALKLIDAAVKGAGS